MRGGPQQGWTPLPGERNLMGCQEHTVIKGSDILMQLKNQN